MSDDITITPIPEKPEWTLNIGGRSGLTIYLPHAPNAFIRWMQHKLLGLKWEKIKE